MAKTAQNVSADQTSPKGTHEASSEGSQDSTPPVHETARLEKANQIIRHNVLWSLGAGVVPIPFADIMAVMAVQLKMLKEFSNLYRVKFTEKIAKKLIGTLVSSVGVVGIGGVIAGSLAKLVPVVGTALGAVSVPVLAGMVTHATGKVFVMHFEAGGTLLDFDPVEMQAHFKKEYAQSKDAVSKMQQEQTAKASHPHT